MQGQIVNGFELKKLLGRGGMAEVWYAENEIGKPAAIKILNENLSHNQQIVERFHNEALVMVKLNHPNIRQVYGYGYLGERHCIIMEYLEGNDLEDLLKDGRRFTDEEVRRWWDQTVDALNYTHAMGVVHRDIKPSNIFLDAYGNIKLLDFGIAKMMENASMTQTGMVMGTPMYMSPEQVNDIKHVDYHTDLYSLAVSFVHMLTGKKPYDDDNCSVFEIQMNIVTKPLDLSEVPEAWRGFLAPYLEKDPQKRPALRRFEAAPPSIKADDDHAGKTESKKQLAATVAALQPKKPINKPQPQESASEAQSKPPLVEPLPSEPQDKSKGKSGLWIGIGIGVVAVIVALVFLLKPKEEPVTIDPDTLAYQACYSVEDLRTYMRDYGRNGLHYNEAKARVDQYVTDSTAKAQQTLAEAQAQQQAAAEAAAKAKAEAEAEAKVEAEKKQAEEAKKPGALKGTICDAVGALPHAILELYRGNESIKGVYSNNDGSYEFMSIPPGKYDVRAKFIGYNSYVLKGVVIQPNKTITWNIIMRAEAMSVNDIEDTYSESRATVTSGTNTGKDSKTMIANEAFYKGMHYLSEDNKKEAMKWLLKAANMNHAEAQYYLGINYFDENEAEALKWLKKSAKNGYKDAQQLIDEL
jgi:serine/threonine protein kinase/TPR repeat protein